MRRRDLLIGSLLASTVGQAWAQHVGKTYRIALVNPAIPVSEMNERSSYPEYSPIFSELRRLGYVEGQNLIVERYSAEGHRKRYDDVAREVVARRPDVIVAATSLLTLRLKAATASVPIVAAMVDPVGFGLVASVAKPGGNITGVAVDAGIGIFGKRLELLRQADPRVSRLGFLASSGTSTLSQEVHQSAQKVGISLLSPRLEDTTEAAYRQFFNALAEEHADGLIATDEPSHLTNQVLITEKLRELRLPAIFGWRKIVADGALMAYTFDVEGMYKHVAVDVAQILAGTAPAEIPIYQSSKFNLIVNLKTARTLGLTLTPSLLAEADEVIE